MEGISPLIFNLTVFVLAIFIGYFVIWSVTPALHTPLMALTNALSGIIIVGAIIAAAPEVNDTSSRDANFASIFGYIAVGIASVNIFGGFIVTQRMLQMFKSKKK